MKRSTLFILISLCGLALLILALALWTLASGFTEAAPGETQTAVVEQVTQLVQQQATLEAQGTRQAVVAESTQEALVKPNQALEMSAEAAPAVGDVIGEVAVRYRAMMEPGTSAQMRIDISRLDRPVFDLSENYIVIFFDQVFHPLNPYAEDIAYTVITGTIKTAVEGPTFQVYPMMPTIQDVALDSPGVRTVWLWTLVAPQTRGKHQVSVLVYGKGFERASWYRTYEILVGEPTPTFTASPSPTATATPALATGTPTATATLTAGQAIGKQLVDHSTEILLGLLGFAGVFVSGYFGIKAATVKAKEAEKPAKGRRRTK